MKSILLYTLIIYTIPFSFLRTKFRKMVYTTSSSLIAIQPKFVKEVKVLLGIIQLKTKWEKKLLKQYRYYIAILIILYSLYLIK